MTNTKNSSLAVFVAALTFLILVGTGCSVSQETTTTTDENGETTSETTTSVDSVLDRVLPGGDEETTESEEGGVSTQGSDAPASTSVTIGE